MERNDVLPDESTPAKELRDGPRTVRGSTQEKSPEVVSTTRPSVAVQRDGRPTRVKMKVLRGVGATTRLLRGADLEPLKAGIEKQVKEHPGRALLVAVGIGYLLGKAFRR